MLFLNTLNTFSSFCNTVLQNNIESVRLRKIILFHRKRTFLTNHNLNKIIDSCVEASVN